MRPFASCAGLFVGLGDFLGAGREMRIKCHWLQCDARSEIRDLAEEWSELNTLVEAVIGFLRCVSVEPRRHTAHVLGNTCLVGAVPAVVDREKWHPLFGTSRVWHFVSYHLLLSPQVPLIRLAFKVPSGT